MEVNDKGDPVVGGFIVTDGFLQKRYPALTSVQRQRVLQAIEDDPQGCSENVDMAVRIYQGQE